MENVKVIAQRYADRPKTDPNARIFDVATDHIVVNPEKLRSGPMYVATSSGPGLPDAGSSADGAHASRNLARLVHRIGQR